MSAETPSGGLERAFRSFEHAARALEDRHAALQQKVERLERELLDSNRRLEAVLDGLASGAAVVSPEGRLHRTNRAFDRCGLADEQRLDHEEILGLVRGNGGNARLTVETATGPRLLSVTVVPVGDREGNRVLTVGDVTEIRREEEEDGRRRRLEALGRMAAELAHEVRNPLGSISLFAAMLRDDLRGESEQRAMTEQILAATSGLEGTVSNLLAFAVPPRAVRRWVDLAAVAREAGALVGPSCAVRGVQLILPADSEQCPIVAETEGLRQVVLNLLANALAATPSGGEVAVRVEPRDESVLLEVADTGRGIDTVDLPLVFDPFFTRTEGGTGLGLSIVHGIVERHGGRIVLDSRPGRGTRARVELPRLDLPTEVIHG